MTAEPQRILLVHDGFGTLRGSEAVALDLMRGLHGITWAVLTDHDEFAQACRAEGFATHVIPFPRPGELPIKPSILTNLASASTYLGRLIRNFRPDLIHINNGGSCPWVTITAWRHHLPTIVHLHAPWSRRMRILRGLYLPDRIVGVSNAIQTGFKTCPDLRKKLRTIYNGIDAHSAEPTPMSRDELSIAENTRVFAFVGVMVGGKRPGDAIEAFRQLSGEEHQRAILLMIGDGPEKEMLELQAHGLPIKFLGQRDDVRTLLSSICDVVVLPSEIEAFSIVLLEAAICGLPRIASDAGGNPESIHDGHDGLLYPLGDIATLTRNIRLLLTDPMKGREMGRNARERVRREFSKERFLTEFFELYVNMLNSDGNSRARKIRSALRSTCNLIIEKY